MSMRDYPELKNVKIPAEQERIMDIICDAWEECRACEYPVDCKYRQDLPEIHNIFTCTALKYSRKIIEAGYAHAKWIDVNDRLPEESTNTPVNIVWMNTNKAPYKSCIRKLYVGTAYYYNGKWWWYSKVRDNYVREWGESGFNCMDDGIVVTHWMPIPALPEAKQ